MSHDTGKSWQYCPEVSLAMESDWLHSFQDLQRGFEETVQQCDAARHYLWRPSPWGLPTRPIRRCGWWHRQTTRTLCCNGQCVAQLDTIGIECCAHCLDSHHCPSESAIEQSGTALQVLRQWCKEDDPSGNRPADGAKLEIFKYKFVIIMIDLYLFNDIWSTWMSVVGDIHRVKFVIIAEDEFRVVGVMSCGWIDADWWLEPSAAFLVRIHPGVWI